MSVSVVWRLRFRVARGRVASERSNDVCLGASPARVRPPLAAHICCGPSKHAQLLMHGHSTVQHAHCPLPRAGMHVDANVLFSLRIQRRPAVLGTPHVGDMRHISHYYQNASVRPPSCPDPIGSRAHNIRHQQHTCVHDRPSALSLLLASLGTASLAHCFSPFRRLLSVRYQSLRLAATMHGPLPALPPRPITPERGLSPPAISGPDGLPVTLSLLYATHKAPCKMPPKVVD